MSDNLKTRFYQILKTDDRIWNEETKIFNYTKLKQLIRDYDTKILEKLMSDELVLSKFFIEVSGSYLLKESELKFFIDEHQLDNSYTKYRNIIGLRLGNQLLKERSEVVIDWPYKDCILRGGMTKEDQKRKEVFFNNILAQDEIDRLLDPKVLVNWKRYGNDGGKNLESLRRDEDGIIRENLVIKGNNLIAIETLKEQFYGGVKVIYIDPPYNTGKDDFGYNDKFNHSSWMTFMKNRLEAAKDLLTPDGAIFIQINDIEHSYLKVLCDEVFDRDNYHTSIIVQMSYLSGVKMSHKEKKLPKIKEYILFYTKSSNIKLIPQYIPATWSDALDRYKSYIKKNGHDDECDKWEIITLREAIQEAGIDVNDKNQVLEFKLLNADLIFRTARNRGADYTDYNPEVFTKVTNSDETYYFVYKGEDVTFAADKVMEINGRLTPVVSIGDIWTDIGINNLSNEGGVELRFGKKPEKLIARIISMISDSEKDIILDFFSGSGTTGAVAHKMGRQYILVEQLDEHIKKTINRLKNVIEGEQSGVSNDFDWNGGGSFVYLELAKWNEEARERIIQSKSLAELKELFDLIYEKYFLNYSVDVKTFKEKTLLDDDFINLNLDEQKQKFIDMLDMNQMYIPFSERHDKKFKLSVEDIQLSEQFFEVIV